MIAFLVVTSGIAVVVGLLEALVGSPRPRRSWAEWRTDLAWWALAPTLQRGLEQVAVVATAIGVAVAMGIPLDGDGIRRGWGPMAALPVGFQALVALVVADLSGTVWHRLRHLSPWWWRVHAVHHSSRSLDWLAATRVHPLEGMSNAVVRTGALLPYGFDLEAVAAVLPAFGLYAILLHANVPWRFGPLRWVVATPAFHRWHHALDARCNYAGLFPIWDLLMGTFHCPAAPPEATGTADPVPLSLLGQLAHPFPVGYGTSSRQLH